MRALIRVLAARSGQLLVPAALASELGISRQTVVRYLDLLDEVFLIKRIPAWSRNPSTRVVSTPKVALVDSGVAANLLGYDASYLSAPTGPLGPLLECFVAMEIARQLTWSRERVDMFHYRTKDQVEVDIVLENRRGKVVAIEVKAASTVRSEDFRGIRHIASRIGEDLTVGLVLYTGQQALLRATVAGGADQRPLGGGRRQREPDLTAMQVCIAARRPNTSASRPRRSPALDETARRFRERGR